MPRPLNGPAVGVGIFLHRADDRSKFLLMQRKGAHGHGTWSIPGGWVEDNESIEDAVRREGLEEVGVALHDVYECDPGWTHVIIEGVNSLCMYYWAIIDGPVKIGEPDKAFALKWVDFTTVRNYKLFPHLEDWLNKASA